jgi:hypothetical protein
MKFSTVLTASSLLLCLAGDAGAAILYSVADDGNGVPRVLQQISTGAHTVSTALTLGDGSLSFAGGLAYHSAGSTFYTMSWDGFNPSNFSSFQLSAAGSTNPVLSAGYGYLDGLVSISPTDFYAIASANDGSSALYRISTAGTGSVNSVMALGFGFDGGLAANGSGLLYAIANDDQANSALYTINPVAHTIGAGVALGQGFTGGLAWDPSSLSLFAIGSDFQADSTLYQIIPGTVITPTVVQSLGVGYLNASLVDVTPAPAGVPEPATVLMGALGMAAVLWARLRSSYRTRQ